jgi:hypothetical protein
MLILKILKSCQQLILISLALLLCPAIASAQEREKAIELLQSLATQLGTLQSPENRARIGANIADSLWPHDEKRARALFISIEDDINWGLRVRENKTSRDDYASIVFTKLRMDTVNRIAKRDPELALEFLRATAPIDEKRPPAAVERERDFELRLAAQIAASNPDLALKIARESLAKGVSDQLLVLLRRLHTNHREQGVTLYKEAVRKLRDSDLTQGRRMVDFTRGLVEFLPPPIADESAFRELVNVLAQAVLAHHCSKTYVAEEASYFCDQARDLLRQMQKLAMAKSSAAERESPSWRTNSLRYAELQEALDRADYDGALELAKQFPDMERTIYWQTAMRARENGDIERARKIANDSSDSDVGRQLLAQLNADEESRSMTDEQLAQVQTQLNKLTDVEDRVRSLADVASRIGAKNRATALKLLDQANGIVEAEMAGPKQIQSQLGLSMLYCVEKSDRGLTMMESLLPKLNELIDAAAKLDGFDTHYIRDGEWNMSKDGTLGEILTFLAFNAGYFAWCDFDRSVNLAAQFERNEIRMMAQVKLAQSILAGPPKHFRF